MTGEWPQHPRRDPLPFGDGSGVESVGGPGLKVRATPPCTFHGQSQSGGRARPQEELGRVAELCAWERMEAASLSLWQMPKEVPMLRFCENKAKLIPRIKHSSLFLLLLWKSYSKRQTEVNIESPQPCQKYQLIPKPRLITTFSKAPKKMFITFPGKAQFWNRYFGNTVFQVME